jgi:ferric-dicitrate binding protein FerR (iron transport regulator)
MSVSDRAKAVAPYLQQVLYDRELQAVGRRAATAGRDAYQRARGKSPSEAVNDKKLWRRAQQAAAAAVQLLTAIGTSPKRRRPRRLRRIALVTVGAAAAYLAFNAQARQTIIGLISSNGPEPTNPPQ